MVPTVCKVDHCYYCNYIASHYQYNIYIINHYGIYIRGMAENCFKIYSCTSEVINVTAYAKLSHLSVQTYSCFITYSNRAHSEQNDDTSMPSTFTLFPEI